MDKYGSLHQGMRSEINFARLFAMMINRTGGLKGKAADPMDYIIHGKKEPEVADIFDVARLLSSLKKG